MGESLHKTPQLIYHSCRILTECPGSRYYACGDEGHFQQECPHRQKKKWRQFQGTLANPWRTCFNYFKPGTCPAGANRPESRPHLLHNPQVVLAGRTLRTMQALLPPAIYLFQRFQAWCTTYGRTPPRVPALPVPLPPHSPDVPEEEPSPPHLLALPGPGEKPDRKEDTLVK